MEPTKPKPQHRHAEAFKLMIYACSCGHRETIWNSRDGVTPAVAGGHAARDWHDKRWYRKAAHHA